MAGFAAAIGGLGEAAARNAAQVRPILEQRRGDLANIIGRAADTETDPQTRTALLQHQADLIAGKPIGKIAQEFAKTAQKRVADEHALQGVVGQPQQGGPPPPPPSSGSGIPGGIQPANPQAQPAPPANPLAAMIGALPPPDAAPAAQPATNPIAGGAQIKPPEEAAASAAMGQAFGAPPAPASAPPSPLGATTAPTSIFNVPSVQDIYGKYASMPEWQTPAGRQALTPFLTAEVNHNEALRQAADLRQMDLTERQTALSGMKQQPFYASLPDVTKAQYEAWAHSQAAQIPNLSAGLIKPFAIGRTEPSTGIPDKERLDQSGRVIDATAFPYVQRMGDFLNGQAYYMPATGPMQTVATTEGGLVNAPRGVAGAISTPGGGAALPTSLLTPRLTGYTSDGHPVYQQGTALIPPGAPNHVQQYIAGAGTSAQFLPRTTTTQRSISTIDDDGHQVTELVPVTSTTQRGGAPVAAASGASGASGAPAQTAPRTFPKGFTPEQSLSNEQKLKQYGIAIDRIKNVMNSLPILNSIIDAGKLSMQMSTDGFLKAVVNRDMKLTPAEANLVGDMQTLTEDINLLRGPLGATGFRGPEAFSALQAQKGQLLARPDVTKRVLANTLQAMQGQYDPLYNAVHPPKKTGAPPPADPDDLLRFVPQNTK